MTRDMWHVTIGQCQCQLSIVNLDLRGHKLCRRAGRKLCDSFKCPVQKRPYPPGVHGKTKKRKGPRTLTDYGFQLQEKQKIRYIYQVPDTQLRNYFRESKSVKEVFQKLEIRLDTVVLRLGFASSRRLAKQLVSHGHFLVNGRRVLTPSFMVKIGDAITIKPSKITKGPFRDLALTLKKHEPPAWLNLNKETLEGTVVALPDLTDGAVLEADFQVVGEFYAR